MINFCRLARKAFRDESRDGSEAGGHESYRSENLKSKKSAITTNAWFLRRPGQ